MEVSCLKKEKRISKKSENKIIYTYNNKYINDGFSLANSYPSKRASYYKEQRTTGLNDSVIHSTFLLQTSLLSQWIGFSSMNGDIFTHHPLSRECFHFQTCQMLSYCKQTAEEQYPVPFSDISAAVAGPSSKHNIGHFTPGGNAGMCFLIGHSSNRSKVMTAGHVPLRCTLSCLWLWGIASVGLKSDLVNSAHAFLEAHEEILRNKGVRKVWARHPRRQVTLIN